MTDARFESGLPADLLSSWRAIFERQRAFAEHAFIQLDDEQFFEASPASGLNSVAVIARHMGGNMLSRWTDFLTTDGEKPMRDRDAELAPFAAMTPGQRGAARAEVMEGWSRGWAALFSALDALTETDLSRTVTIRGAPHSVHGAIARQLDHYAFHVGQINLIARMLVGPGDWKWFTIPPGGTRAFNDQMRRGPAGAPGRD